MTTIVFSTAEWNSVHARIAERNPPSVMLIRSTMKRTLGFVVRNHHVWSVGQCKTTVCLDFYDEAAATMFRLTYL